MIRTLLRPAALAGAATTVVLVLAACGGSGDGGHEMPGTGQAGTRATPAGSAPAGAAFNDADVMFAQMMIPHHRQAVEMAAMAEGSAVDPEVKALAAKIKAAQDPEIATMTGWLTAWARPTTAPDAGGMDHGAGPGAMPGMMSDADLAALKAASGKDFDKRFVTMMIAHHRGAITMAEEAIAKGSHADAKALAQQIVTSQQAEIEAMEKIATRQ